MRGVDDTEDLREPAVAVSWARRAGWFVALWAGSILALGVVAYGIRSMIL